MMFYAQYLPCNPLCEDKKIEMLKECKNIKHFNSILSFLFFQTNTTIITNHNNNSFNKSSVVPNARGMSRFVFLEFYSKL